MNERSDPPEPPERPDRPDRPEPGAQPDHDVAWAAIVANFGERVDLDAAAPHEPVTEGPSTQPTDPPPDEPRFPSLAPLARASEDAERARAAQDAAPDDEHDHYVPPPPPPLPQPRGYRLLAWVGLLGVPVVLLLVLGSQWTVPSYLGLLLMIWFVGGFTYLVGTMHKEGPDDPWDDGARI